MLHICENVPECLEVRHEIFAIPVEIQVPVMCVQKWSSCEYNIFLILNGGTSSVAIGVKIVLVRENAEGPESWLIHLNSS